MTLKQFDSYKNGECFATGYVNTFGIDAARRAIGVFERRGTSSTYLAGMTDALLEYVQTREELAPGCYRVRPLKGAE